MTLRALWLPGGWLSTNELLAMQRSTGYYHGVRAATRGRQNRGGDPVHSFGAEVKRMRYAAAMAARRVRMQPLTEPVGLVFVLFGHERYDPSAWYLAGKAVEDGLRDAGVIRNDRFGVNWTAGKVAHPGDRGLVDTLAFESYGVRPEGPGLFVLMRGGGDVLG